MLYIEQRIEALEARIAALEARLGMAPAPSEEPATEPDESPRRADETHVEAWRRWRKILRDNPDARIEYINPACAWTQSKRGIDFHENTLSEKPATVREADELTRRYSSEGAFGHLAWLLTWQEAAGYPFIRIHLPQ
jgi:hypothetical protein